MKSLGVIAPFVSRDLAVQRLDAADVGGKLLLIDAVVTRAHAERRLLIRSAHTGKSASVSAPLALRTSWTCHRAGTPRERHFMRADCDAPRFAASASITGHLEGRGKFIMVRTVGRFVQNVKANLSQAFLTQVWPYLPYG